MLNENGVLALRMTVIGWQGTLWGWRGELPVRYETLDKGSEDNVPCSMRIGSGALAGTISKGTAASPTNTKHSLSGPCLYQRPPPSATLVGDFSGSFSTKDQRVRSTQYSSSQCHSPLEKWRKLEAKHGPSPTNP